MTSKDSLNSNLFNLNPLPSWIYNHDTLQIIDVNIAAVEHYGYTKEEFLELNLKDLGPDEEAQKIITTNENIKNQNINVYIGIFTQKKKDGTLIYTEKNVRKIVYNNQNCILVVLHDVTKRIEQEQQIIQSEQRFKTLVQEGNDMISIIDANGKFNYTSPTTTTILSRNPEEFQGKTIFDFIHQEDIEKVSDYIDSISKEKKVIVEPYRLKDGNNEWRWVETVLTNMIDNPAIKGIVANSRDISKKKKEEHELKLLSSVITNTKDSVIITEIEAIDQSGPKIIYVNKAFTQLTGYSESEVIGKTTKFLQGPNTGKKELNQLSNALIGFESCETTILNYKKNGEEFWNNLSLSPVTDENGIYTHWIAILRDVTEQKQNELENNLLGKISLNFSSEKNLLASAKSLCKTICEYDQFDLVELWIPNIENTELKKIANNAATTNGVNFCELSKDIKTLKLGEGLPGIVWRKKSTVLLENINKKDDFIRKDAAEKTAIKNAVSFPLIYNNNIVGILLIATQKEINHLKKHLKIFEHLKQYIGSEINRKKLESDLNYLHDISPYLICTINFRGKFLKINKTGFDLLGFNEEELLNKSFYDFIHPDDIEISKEEIENIKKNKITNNLENRLITKNGKILWLNWSCKASHEEGIIYGFAKNITEEKKLIEINKRSSKLAKISGWEYDIIENKLFWSEETHNLHETNPNTYIPCVNNAIDFYKSEYKDLIIKKFNDCITTGEPYELEAIIITKNNKERWIRTIGKAEFVNGKPIRVCGSIQDIHEKKILELERNSLLNTLEKSHNEIYVFDSNTFQFIYANKGALINIGYSIDEIKKLTPIDIQSDYSIESFNELITPLMDNEKEKLIFFTNHQRKDGSKYPIEVHLQLVSENNHRRFLAVVLDKTERKKSEKKIIQANERFEIVTQATNDDIWDWDIRENSFFRSQNVKKFFGDNTLSNLNEYEFWKDKFHPKDIDKTKKSLYDAIENPLINRWEAEYRVFNESGEIVYVIDRGIIIRDHNGEAIRMIGAMTNITEQKNHEAQLISLNQSLQSYAKELERSNEELEQFAFITSHDLQEPLRMISSFMDQLKRKYEDKLDDKALKYIEFATNGSKRMKQIILDILDYSRAGRPTDLIEEVNINEIIANYKILRNKIISEKSTIISHEEMPTIITYKSGLIQIFHSLLDNAIKYSKKDEAPIIEISYIEKKDKWVFAVKDNGIGIDSKFFSKIFIIFQRLHNQQEYDGTGIGLSIVKRHIDFLGGKIWLESELEKGTTFYFEIPKTNEIAITID